MRDLLGAGGQILVAYSLLLAVVGALILWSACKDLRSADWPVAQLRPGDLARGFALAAARIREIPGGAQAEGERLAGAARTVFGDSAPEYLLLSTEVADAVSAVELAAAAVALSGGAVGLSRLARSLDELDRIVGGLSARG